ncbi:MAG: hypothetical protein AABZ60_16200 [Planctomycetota bacterium]
MPTLEEMFYLKEFQVKRLQETYQDFMTQPIYESAGEFFFVELYGPKDHTSRDQGFEFLHRHLSDKFGAKLIEDMGYLIELNRLSNDLDQQLYTELVKQFGKKNFRMEEYQVAYLNCNNYDLRMKQIEGIHYAVETFYNLAKRPMVGLLLKSVSLTAKLIGAKHMIDFLRGGYEAFRCIPDIDPFQNALKERELFFLNHIYKK